MLNLSACFEGYYGQDNPPSLTIAKAPETSLLKTRRYLNATRLDNGQFRFYFTTRLGIGLSNFNSRPIPRQCPIRLTFYRASAEKGLLSAIDPYSGTIEDYPERVIKLVDPVLHVSYIESQAYDKKYMDSRIENVTIPYLDYSIRRELLLEGIANFTINIGSGSLPGKGL